MTRRAFVWLGSAILAATAAAQAPPSPPSDGSALARIFWAGIERLNMIFTAVGTLSGGANRGEVWVADLRTGGRSRVGTAGDLAWPVLAPDGVTIFALRGRKVIRFGPSGEGETAIGGQADWRKLMGVGQDGAVLGFVAGVPLARPALITPQGELLLLPEPATDEERRNVSLLLQQNRAYTGGRKLLVERSARGGRGFDVLLIEPGAMRNLSDCGDDACGQPSLSSDGTRVLYVRAAQR